MPDGLFFRPPHRGRPWLAGRSLLGAVPVALVATTFMLSVVPLKGQSRLERTSNLDGSWLGAPWVLHFDFSTHVPAGGPAGEPQVLPTYHAALGVPLPLLFGARYAPDVSTPLLERVWEVYARYAERPFDALPGLDVAASAWYSAASEAVDGEILLGHGFGPARFVGAFRSYTSLLPGERVPAIAGGALVHVAPGRLPVAIAADAARAFDAGADLPAVWSVGLQLGVPHTSVTSSVVVTNAIAPTLQAGVTAVEDGVRLGISISAPLPVGRMAGWRPHRWEPGEAVIEEALPDPAASVVPIRNYAFDSGRIRIPAGGVVEWRNHDAARHTITADDGAFASGPLGEEDVWRVQLMEPGVYTVHCAVHPYMSLTVVVAAP